jgi:hypothetical protein
MPYDDDIIANMALGHVGVGVSINNLSTDNSAEGLACRRYITSCRDTILEMKPWAFATQRWTLQELSFLTTDHYAEHWAKRYKRPDDCIRPNRIINPAARTPATETEKIPFKVVRNTDGDGGQAILTDQTNAILEGNIANPDTAEYSATFAEGQSLFLATRISPQLRVNPKLSNFVMQQWMAWQAEAMNQNDELGQVDPEPESAYEAVRS